MTVHYHSILHGKSIRLKLNMSLKTLALENIWFRKKSFKFLSNLDASGGRLNLSLFVIKGTHYKIVVEELSRSKLAILQNFNISEVSKNKLNLVGQLFRNTRKKCEMLTRKIPERRQLWICFTNCSGVSIVDFEQVNTSWEYDFFLRKGFALFKF